MELIEIYGTYIYGTFKKIQNENEKEGWNLEKSGWNLEKSTKLIRKFNIKMRKRG